MSTVTVGRKVPSFKAEATGGRTIASKDLVGAPFVLYFYPRDNTPGCTQEGQDFRDLHAEFERNGIRVLGVSRDSLKSHEGFKSRHELPFDLIADPDETLCEKFGVMKDKNMYGKQVRGIERSTFLFDADGRLVREWRKVSVGGHAEEVLEAAKAL